MGRTPLDRDAYGTDSRHYAQYTSAATAELASGGRLREAMDTWASFVTDSRGDVFDRLGPDASCASLFVDALYVDSVVDRFLRSIQDRFGVRLVNPDAGHNTDALPFALRPLHDPIRDRMADELGADALGPPADELDPTGLPSAFGSDLYQHVVSEDLRRLLGEYYTPPGIAELAVAELDAADVRSETVLDPGCGSGVFLAACIDAKRAAAPGDADPASFVADVTDTVYGIDLNPVAVRTAKLTYLVSLLPELGADTVDRVEVPVLLTDALGVTRADDLRVGGEPFDPTVDHLVGNPPWLTWSSLPESVRAAWRDRGEETAPDSAPTSGANGEPDSDLELLPHRGIRARLGHGNDDVSLPFVWVCLDRYLAAGGDASVVLKRGIAKGPAGRLLRRQRVGSRRVAVRHVHDFGRLRPFDGADVNAAVYTLCADREPAFPIAADAWRAGDADPSFSSAETMDDTLRRDRTGLVPVDPADPASSWIRTDAERRALGSCAHTIRHGVKDDAADVYTVDREQLADLEPDHVYPYLRSKHVVKYGLFGHDLHLVPLRRAGEDNADRLRAEQPKTYAYLRANRDALEGRSSAWLADGPFYNVFGLGPYTWADYKVVWCRLGFKPHFAVVSTVEDDDLGTKPVVPGDHCMFVPTDDEREAHFLCALLNSAPYQRSLEALASEGKASLSKAVVSELALPAYDDTDPHRRLAELSMAAHRIVPEYTDRSKRAYNAMEIEPLTGAQAEIDRLVERLLAGRPE